MAEISNLHVFFKVLSHWSLGILRENPAKYRAFSVPFCKRGSQGHTHTHARGHTRAGDTKLVQSAECRPRQGLLTRRDTETMTGVAAVAPRVSDRAAEETGIAVAPEFANADRDVRRTTPTSADATDAKHHEGQVESSDSDSNQDGVKRNDEGREHGEGASKKVSWCPRVPHN